MIVASVAACGASPAPSPNHAGGDPLRLTGGEARHDTAGSTEARTALVWTVAVVNTADASAVVDSYELVDKSPTLEVLGATSVPNEPGGLWTVGLVPASGEVRSAVAARPLVGATIGSTNVGGWTTGGRLVFLLEAPTAGDYALSAVRVRYHVGSQAFDTTLAASLDVCMGASAPPDPTCPPPSSSPGG